MSARGHTGKVLVYDGDCSMCRGLSRIATRSWLTGPAKRAPFDDFEGETAGRLMEAGIHNELAAIDSETGEIRSGYDGILWLLRDGRLRWLAALIALPGLFHIGRFLYRTVSYNRRVLAPVPRGTVACACDPDERALYRGALIAICLLVTVLSAAVFEQAANHVLHTGDKGSPGQHEGWGWYFIAGWLVAALLVMRPAQRRLAGATQLAWTQAIGCLPVLLGGLLLGRVGAGLALPVFVGSLVGGLLLTLFEWRRQMRELDVRATAALICLCVPLLAGPAKWGWLTF